MPSREFSVEDFVRIQNSQGPSFSSDGSHIAFRSNRSGVSQAYVAGAAGEGVAPARQVTDTGGVIYLARFRSGRDELLYVADDGGDEQYQIHLADVSGGRSREVVSAPHVINEFAAISPDGRFASYRSNQRDRRFFDIWVVDLDSGESRCVLQSDDSNAADRFSPDGRFLVVSRPNLEQPGDSNLFLVDLSAGPRVARLVTPHEGVAGWSDASVHPSGALIAVSDEGREFDGVQRIDPDSGAREFILERPWDVEGIALSVDGTRIAVIVNEDGYSRLEVFELTSEGRLGAGIQVPRLPDGVASGLVWSPDGRRLAFDFAGPRNLTDVWLADLDSGDMRQVTRSDAHGIPVEALPQPRLVRYKTFDGRLIPAYYYRPAVPAGQRLPCMVLVHGGPEGQSRPLLWGRFPAAEYLLSRGEIALLVPNVRGSTGYGKEYAHADDVERRMDSVRDLNAAVDWLVGTGEIDPARIGVMGGSYGGFMTLAAITEEPEVWAAAIDSYGIANFETFLENTGPWRRLHRAREYGSDPAFLKTISPIFKADRIRTPLMVIQGDHDVRVPPEESEQIVNTVRRNEGIVEYIVFEREGHGIQKVEHKLEMARRQEAFLREHLLGG